MCTFFTLTYTCTHTQTSHRCPRATTTIYNSQGEPTTHIAGCDNKMYLGSTLAEPCIECKMKAGVMPGVQTGADRWAVWGPKEEAIARRQQERARVEAERKVGGEVAAGSSEMGGVNRIVREESRDLWVEEAYQMQGMEGMEGMQMPTMTGAREMDGKNDASKYNTGGHVVGEQGQEQEADDDWMYGGIKAFGGELVGKGKEVTMGGEWEDGEEEVWVGSERFTKRMGM